MHLRWFPINFTYSRYQLLGIYVHNFRYISTLSKNVLCTLSILFSGKLDNSRNTTRPYPIIVQILFANV